MKPKSKYRRTRQLGCVRRYLFIFHLSSFILASALSACSSAAPTPLYLPRLLPDASVAGDFADLAQLTWQQFLAVFAARTGCFGDIHLRAATDLASRAAYDPPTATVTVRVPGTRAMLQSALVHEWAHHIEFQCPAQQQLRAPFVAAQGLPAATVWRPDNTPATTPESIWATIPSEQFAEATIEVVLGERQIPTTAPVTAAGVRLIAVWAAGR